MDLYKIIENYREHYTGQEPYYHNFEHALWVTKKGLEIIKIDGGVPEELQRIYTHAMSCHDAGHLCGQQSTDRENVDKALLIFKEKEVKLSHDSKKMASGIIDATCVPYVDTKQLVQKWFITRDEEEAFAYLVDVARDADHMGIIGITDIQQREQALVGIMREALVGREKGEVLKRWLSVTHTFFDSISFRTSFAKEWSEENLEGLRKWHLDFSEEAILIASDS